MNAEILYQNRQNTIHPRSAMNPKRRIHLPLWLSLADATRFRILILGLTLVTVYLPLQASSAALYQTGFERPAFSPGLPIRDQDSWEMLHDGEAISVSTNGASTGTQCLVFDGAWLEPQPDTSSLAACSLSTAALDLLTGTTPPTHWELHCDVRLDGPQIGTRGTPDLDYMSANLYAVTDSGKNVGGFIVSSAGRIWTASFAPGHLYKSSVPYTMGSYRHLTLRVDLVTRTLTYLVDGLELGSSPINPSNTDAKLARADLILNGPSEPVKTSEIDYDPTNYHGYFDNYAINTLSGTAITAQDIAQQAYLKASNTQGEKSWGSGDEFGFSVAVSGNTVVVGAPYEDSRAIGVNGNQADNSVRLSGAAYVFVRQGTNWSQQAYLKATPSSANGNFGQAVAIEGDTIVVGAPGQSSGNSAGAYVFIREGTNWTRQASLRGSNTEAGDVFGFAVSLSRDTLIVGAPYEASNGRGVNGTQNNNSTFAAGAAYVFLREGTNWVQQAYLKASNSKVSSTPQQDVLGDLFGFSVAVDGDTIIVGAAEEDSDATGVNGDQSNTRAPRSGAAYIFVRGGNTWTHQAYLKASNTGRGDSFGGSVAISGDTAVVGAYQEDSNARGINSDPNNNSRSNSGSAYVFVRRGADWTQEAYLKASNPDAEDWFGRSVTISGDTISVGAPFEDSTATGVNGSQTSNAADGSGAAYLFTRNGTSWSQVAYLKPSNSSFCWAYGFSVALSGDLFIAGASGEFSNAIGVNGNQRNSNAIDSGAAYLYTFTRPTAPDLRIVTSRNGDVLKLMVTGTPNTKWRMESRNSLSGAEGWQPLTNFTMDLSPFVFDQPIDRESRFYRGVHAASE